MLPNTVVLETNQLCAVHKEGVTEIWSTDGDTLFGYLMDGLEEDRTLTDAINLAFRMYEMGYKHGVKIMEPSVQLFNKLK